MVFGAIRPGNDRIAVIDAATGRSWTYAALQEDVARIQAALPSVGRKSLGLLLAHNRYECVAAYIAALNAASALILIDASLNIDLLEGFIEAYRPDWIFTPDAETEFQGYRRGIAQEAGLLQRESPEEVDIHPDLALLLNTSGSTGSPKLVRLTARSLLANARSIAQYLQITEQDRPITSLPMSYSYGLSVINSHLHAGAAIILTEHPVLRREFWDAVDRYQCTSLAGVPYTYQLLLKTGLLTKKGASLKVLTQAGGRLDEALILQMNTLAAARGWKFFVMYGQTEATARISYVPFEMLGEKAGSIGIPIPEGSIATDESSGELIYSGSNVMMGYAENREDLAKGDELGGVLKTGDLARQDSDGYFYITGRLKRFIKLFGKRFNLDELERIIAERFGTTSACYGYDDLLMVAVTPSAKPEPISAALCEMFELPRAVVQVIVLSDLPYTPSGKLDYHRLATAQGELQAAG